MIFSSYLFYVSYVSNHHILGEKYRIPSPTRERGDGMEATECPSPNKTSEVKLVKQKPKTPRNKKHLDDKLIILPQTGLAVKKLPPITGNKSVPLPSKTPSSPLVKVIEQCEYDQIWNILVLRLCCH